LKSARLPGTRSLKLALGAVRERTGAAGAELYVKVGRTRRIEIDPWTTPPPADPDDLPAQVSILDERGWALRAGGANRALFLADSGPPPEPNGRKRLSRHSPRPATLRLPAPSSDTSPGSTPSASPRAGDRQPADRNAARLAPPPRPLASLARHCAELVDFLGLGAHVGRPVGLLPYGVQKRIEIGRALAAEPRLLMLDEPVAGMTRAERSETGELLSGIRAEMGLTMLLVEHHMHLVLEVADRVVAMNFGAVIASGAPEEVANHPAVVEAYLGAGGSNGTGAER